MPHYRRSSATCADVTDWSGFCMISSPHLVNLGPVSGCCRVTVVLPCLNEAASLPGVLADMPAGYLPLVVDNNSTDGTADVALRLGAQVVTETQPGYGAAVHAGIVAASTPVVAVLDGDGSMDPQDLPRLVAELDRGADMAVGRRRPAPGCAAVARAVWQRGGVLAVAQPPWPRRARHRAHAGREAGRRPGVGRNRPSIRVSAGTIVRAAAANWRVVEHDVVYGPRTGGKSKVSGSLRGSVIAALDFWRAIS